ncbi:ATP synthase F1 subunit delta [Reichenbachiella carrageenanivorans]|uniref:ATP synthase subunit delta n=1 Tax=Reichenbachiella carrageenanivorans TaxID=2979869 RepID=A0ABY6D1V8_9BACT|nr:ATP synthase F1 subunit delta [Reichenbachiella carrageenanivorans]UXX80142.1 ATP synthase F1 subunit delta [Reichenbachiella carrageenanivorans]
MSEFRIASRYAKSLLELAVEKKCLDEVNADMYTFTDVCKNNSDLVLLLKSPVIAHYKKLSILKEVFNGKVNDMTMAIFDILAKKNREMYLPEVAAAFKSQYNLFKGIVESTITTVNPISEEVRKEISAIVKKITNQEVVLTEKTNPELIGGFVLKIGDKQIDDSVSGKLKELRFQFVDKGYVSKM